jgi:hypothetical protein
MNLFRFPALFRIFFILSFIVVAGFAFDEWRKDAERMTQKLRIIVLAVAGLFLGFVVYALFQKGLNMMDFFKNHLFVASEKSLIFQHILFQGTIQLVFLGLFLLLLTKWRLKKYALAAILFIATLDMILATRLNGPYTIN